VSNDAPVTKPSAQAKPVPVDVTVKPDDSMQVSVKQGQTLYLLARLYADDKNHDGSITGKELSGYVENLKKANGGNPAMTVGQPIKIPNKDASFKVELGIAIQKWLSASPQAGKGKEADYDWDTLAFTGLMDGSIATVNKKDGSTERFVVLDDMSGEAEGVHQVMPAAEYQKARGIDEAPNPGEQFKSELGSAITKWLIENPKAGKGNPMDYDWNKLDFASISEGSVVTVPKRSGGSEQFVVLEDMSSDTASYTVKTKRAYDLSRNPH
jgi:hypothetical protein